MLRPQIAPTAPALQDAMVLSLLAACLTETAPADAAGAIGRTLRSGECQLRRYGREGALVWIDLAAAGAEYRVTCDAAARRVAAIEPRALPAPAPVLRKQGGALYLGQS